ncbi:hypothetical protein BpHYR1_041710, partial [Brachionus plicatilis]
MLFDESDSSLNSNDNSFLSNSSDEQIGKKFPKNRNIVNHFLVPEKPKPRLKQAKDVIEELISQKTENSLKLTNRNNSNIKSVHFTSPLAMQTSWSNSPSHKLPTTPKPSATEAHFLKPSLAKTKYASTPLAKTDVVRSSSLRYANPSSLKLYFSNQNSTTGRLDETKSFENLKEPDSVSPNTHTINRLVKMASSWSVKSRASSTSSNYVDPNLVSQLKIKQAHMFLSDENDYATIESCLSRQLGKNGLADQPENKRVSSLVRKGRKFQPIDTSSQRSSVIDDGELLLPRMETKYNSQKMTFVKQRLTRSFRLVNVNRSYCHDKKATLIKDHKILKKDGHLAIP